MRCMHCSPVCKCPEKAPTSLTDPPNIKKLPVSCDDHAMPLQPCVQVPWKSTYDCHDPSTKLLWIKVHDGCSQHGLAQISWAHMGGWCSMVLCRGLHAAHGCVDLKMWGPKQVTFRHFWGPYPLSGPHMQQISHRPPRQASSPHHGTYPKSSP